MVAAPPALSESPTQTAGAYARHLLTSLGAAPGRTPKLLPVHPAQRWAESGLMTLTGPADTAGWMCPIPLSALADGALAALDSLAPEGALHGVRGAELLTERAAIAGLRRAGAVSAGGSCRLLAAQDGGIALNLARDDDWALMPAWLQDEIRPDWDSVAAALHHRRVADLLEQGRLLGLAVAAVQEPAANVQGAHWFHTQHPTQIVSLPRPPRVVDLSSLWAGPLCSHLLQRLGAEVIKVESPLRPDGARRGPTAFFDLLHAGKRSVALDATTPQGRAQLRALLASADIVIEASRPRALRQLGIAAEEIIAGKPGLHWIAISGHGREEPVAQWIAYGDDAGVAAGLSHWMQVVAGMPVFVGDAIADPLTGLHAALLAWARWQQGQGGLTSVALVDVVRHGMLFCGPLDAPLLRQRFRAWKEGLRVAGIEPVLPPPRSCIGPAPALGADTAAVMQSLGFVC